MNVLPKQPFLCMLLSFLMVGLHADFAFAGSADESKSAANINEKCLDCHGHTGKVGGRFFIEPARFSRANHAGMGCLACHVPIPRQHPATMATFPKTDCAGCHREIATEYSSSSHAAKADCVNCHDPHQEDLPPGFSWQNSIRMCAGCHERSRIIASHGRWLPQTDLHIEMLPCLACHTDSRSHVVTLYLVRRQDDTPVWQFDPVGYDELTGLAGGKGILSLIDTNGDRRVSLSELRVFERTYSTKGVRLQAEITPERFNHVIRKPGLRFDCSACHSSQPDTRESIFIAIPEKDGTFRRVAVEKGADPDPLSGAADFYMIGKSRSTACDRAGLLIIVAGIAVPAGRAMFRLFRR